jgi:hypothetical protein
MQKPTFAAWKLQELFGKSHFPNRKSEFPFRNSKSGEGIHFSRIALRSCKEEIFLRARTATFSM